MDLTTHSVSCVLQEPDLFMPSQHLSSSSAASNDCGDKSQTANASSTRKGKTPKRGRARSPVGEEGFAELLSKAKGCLGEIFSPAVASGSTRDNHNMSYLLGRISM